MFEGGFISGFGEFLIRPFTNPIGIGLLILVLIYIILRLTGKISFGRKGGGGGDKGSGKLPKNGREIRFNN